MSNKHNTIISNFFCKTEDFNVNQYKNYMSALLKIDLVTLRKHKFDMTLYN